MLGDARSIGKVLLADRRGRQDERHDRGRVVVLDHQLHPVRIDDPVPVHRRRQYRHRLVFRIGLIVHRGQGRRPALGLPRRDRQRPAHGEIVGRRRDRHDGLVARRVGDRRLHRRRFGVLADRVRAQYQRHLGCHLVVADHQRQIGRVARNSLGVRRRGGNSHILVRRVDIVVVGGHRHRPGAPRLPGRDGEHPVAAQREIAGRRRAHRRRCEHQRYRRRLVVVGNGQRRVRPQREKSEIQIAINYPGFSRRYHRRPVRLIDIVVQSPQHDTRQGRLLPRMDGQSGCVGVTGGEEESQCRTAFD